MLKAKIFTLAALVVVLMSNVYVGWAEDSDTLWTKDLSGNGFVINALFSPDDKTIFVSTTENFFELDALTGNIIREIPGIRGMERFIDDFKYFISYDMKKYSYPEMILVKDYEAIFKRNSFGGIGGYDIAPIGNYMYCVIDSLYYGNISYSNLYIFDLLNEKEIYRKELDENYDRIAISKDLKSMVTFSYYLGVVSDDNDDKALLKVWDLQTKSLQKVIFDKKPTDMMKNYLKFSPDGNYFAYLESSYIYLYDTKTWELVDTFKFDGLSIYCFTFSNDSKLLYLINDNGGIEVYQIKNKQYVRTIGPKWGSILLNISYNNNFIVGCGGHYVMMWKNTLTSINEQINQKVEINPNPVKGTLIINNIQLDSYDIEIYDINSNIMFNKIGIVNQNNSFSIDANFLPSGVYILKLKSNGKEINTKFIKE